MALDVFITVDVEHAGSSHARSRPGTRLPPASLECRDGNRALGLPLLLDILAGHGLKATFFVEPLSRHYYGDGPMADAVAILLRKGMDVELHAHPAWLRFADGRERSDKLSAFPAQEQLEILAHARDLLRSYGAEARAFRAGGFCADNATYGALRSLGIRYSSSYNLSQLGGDCRIDVPGPRNDVFAAEGCLEVPLTNYLVRDFRKGLGYAAKHFQAGNTPFSRGKALLESAHAAGMRCVTLLLHNFEFVRRDGREWFLGPFREHAAVVRGFRETCAFLAENPERFRAVTFADLEPGWPFPDGGPGEAACHLPKVPGIYLPL